MVLAWVLICILMTNGANYSGIADEFICRGYIEAAVCEVHIEQFRRKPIDCC